MLVELDIFSGRPNPRWRFDEPTARRLVVIHRRLEPADRPRPEPPGLGYRGFIYRIDDATWRAFGSVVAGPATVLADPTRTVEAFLLDELPSDYEDLRPTIAHEIFPEGSPGTA